MLEGQPHRAVARLHSSGGAFTVSADRMLNETGTVAIVLPSAIPTAPGNQELRRDGGSSGQSSPSSTTSGMPPAICALLPSTSVISTGWRH